MVPHCTGTGTAAMALPPALRGTRLSNTVVGRQDVLSIGRPSNNGPTTSCPPAFGFPAASSRRRRAAHPRSPGNEAAACRRRFPVRSAFYRRSGPRIRRVRVIARHRRREDISVARSSSSSVHFITTVSRRASPAPQPYI